MRFCPQEGPLYNMKRQLLILVAFLAFPSFLTAATQTSVRLVLDRDTARPGEPVWAGIHMRMPGKWHTYWKNSGDSGAPTTIQWSLPDGVKAGEIQWPVPRKHQEADLTTYVYYEEVVLLIPLTLDSRMPPGTYNLQADISWLECEKQCVPGESKAAVSLRIADESRLSADAPLMDRWRQRLPQDGSGLALNARWLKQGTNASRSMIAEGTVKTPPTSLDFYPYASESFEVDKNVDAKMDATGGIQLGLSVRRFEEEWPDKIAGLLIVKGADTQEPAGYEVILAPRIEKADGMGPERESSLWQMLFYAFLGGLILNVMPCVLPVISLKILSFVGQSRESPGRVRLFGFLYAAGVLTSFLLLAAVVIAVQRAGQSASWGMQFGDPRFLTVLCLLITGVALNLFGVFEVTLSGRLMGTAGELASQEGKTGAFFNGVLATALATPCTAPFLGAAMGFAFTQSSISIVLGVFAATALGLALPYVLLTWNPGWLRFVPKPGPWMVRFKIAMGFPLLATAVWLLFLAIDHYGKQGLWLGLFLVSAATSAWVYGEFVQRGGRHRGIAIAAALILLLGGYYYALERQLQWRRIPEVSPVVSELQSHPGGIAWQRWNPDAVRKARAEGKVVFVDFTADWCLTCNANKKFSIEIAAVVEKLKAIDAIAFLADYTRPAASPEITEELRKHGRAGVPLVLVYPKKPELPPLVLPELLTPAIVLDALTRAAQ